MNYPSIRIEGAILSPDILERLEDAPGQRPSDFGLAGAARVKDEIARARADAQDYWRIFQRKLETLRPDSAATIETRQQWVVPLLGLLGSLSVLTIGELEKGMVKLPVSSRRTGLETWVRSDLADRFRERLLAMDGTVAPTWGKHAGEAEVRGESLSVIDGLISATGIAHHLIIATRNIGDFERCGASCFNPWMQS